MEALNKIKSTVTGAPIGALVGAVVGLFVARQVKYNHSLMVVSFAMVGMIIGGTVGSKIKK